MHQMIPLNFDWKFVDHVTFPLSFEKAVIVHLPHTNKIVPKSHFDVSEYETICAYQKMFPTPKDAKHGHVFIRFGAVMNKAEVRLNDELLGVHEGGYTPFQYEITSFLHDDADNCLEVIVDTHEISDIPPFGHVVDYLGYGGIYREVVLEIAPKKYITNVTLKTRESIAMTHSVMMLDFTVNFSEEIHSESKLIANIYQHQKLVLTKEYELKDASSISQSALCEDIERWTLEKPSLYEFEVKLYKEETLIDESRCRFGFRDAKFTPEGFVLNNELITLIGLNRHQSYPYVGYAMPKRMQEKDAEILKFELGCNIVRTSHYMQSDHFINRCDEIGLLVFEEIPGWQYIGNEHFKELSLANLKAMIEAHRNHPSIVLWGTRINESPDDHDFYTKTSELAYELDDSRQIGGVRNFHNSELLEDVYTFNDFSHVGDNPGLEHPRKVIHPIVPYLVTEHNGHIFPTKKTDPEEKRAEQAKRHLKVIDSAYQYSSVSGAIGWCLADYNTHKDFGSGDRVCHHGVMDMFRIPKYASSAYASQGKKEPYLEVLSNMAPGEYPRSVIQEVVVATNCDYVKVYFNEELINTYYGDWQLYKYLPHPPVIITDFIGSRLEEHGRFSKRIARRLKKVLLSYNKHGFAMPLLDKIRMGSLFLFHHFTMEEAAELYEKYLGSWGEELGKYRFEGYIGDELKITKEKGQSSHFELKAKLDHDELLHQDTYDVTRIVVSLEDEFGNPYPTANFPVQIKTSANLEVIGPSIISLSGGSEGFYVKTLKKGPAKVTISAHGFEDILLKIDIK